MTNDIGQLEQSAFKAQRMRKLPLWMPTVVSVAQFLVLACCASGQGLIYYDADISIINGVDNIAAADGTLDPSLYINGSVSDPAADGLWDIRGATFDGAFPSDFHGARPAGASEPFGNDEEQSVFAANGRGPEDPLELVQTVSDLATNSEFDVYAVYWSATNDNWAIRAGLASNQGANPLFSRTGASIGDESTTPGVSAAIANWTTAPGPNSDPGLFEEGNRTMLLGKVGSTMSSGTGKIDVFIDDVSNGIIADENLTRTFFDGIAVAPAGAAVVPTVTLDRDTGILTVGSPLAIKGYSISSASGELDPAVWNSIAAGSNSSVDTDPWEITTSNDNNLEEAETPVNDGVTLLTPINAGVVWRKSPFEDISLTVTLMDDTQVLLPVELTGTGYEFGDIDTDRDIDVDDYIKLVSNLHATIDTEVNDTDLEQYLLGDLTGDAAVTYSDIIEFRNLFAAANPGVSLEAVGVPEPGSLWAISSLLCLVLTFRWFKRNGHSAAPNSKPKRQLPGLTLNLSCRRLAYGASCSIAAICFAAASSQAQPLYNVQFGNQAGQTGVYMPDLVNVTVAPGVNGSSAQSILDTETVQDEVSAQFVFANDQPASNSITGGPLRVEHNPGDDVDETEFEEGYFLIEVAPNLGTFDLDNLTFEAQRATGGDSQRGFELYVETNGSAFDFNSSPQLLDIDFEPTNRNDGPTNYDVDLTGLDFQGISSVAFRFYHTSASTGGMEFGNISLFGSGVDASALSLEVNRGDGSVAILNEDASPLSLDYYEIRSPEGALNPTAWNSLDDQDPEPDGPNDGWIEAGGSSNMILSEVRGLNEGNVTVPATTGMLDLGDAFTPGGAENLSFSYALDNGNLVIGDVDYVGTAPEGLLGDFNGDDIVNIADYTVWRDNLGAPDSVLPAGSTNDGSGTVDAGDYATWKTNFGSTAGAGALSTGALSTGIDAVPEPASYLLAASFLMAVVVCRPRH